MSLSFAQFWSKFEFEAPAIRQQFFSSLSRTDQQILINSFYNDGWLQFFFRNELENRIERVKRNHNINLIDLRIKAIKFGRVFLIDRCIWEDIEDLFMDISEHCNLDLIFGNLVISSWGKKKQFCKIRAHQ